MKIEFRPISDGDIPFLKKVYRSTREDELQLTDWPESQKESFIDQQFSAQNAYYQDVYYDSSFEVILIDDEEAGRLYLGSQKINSGLLMLHYCPSLETGEQAV